jgi:hypothetical protein
MTNAPPGNVNEKTKVQALDRTQPVLPPLPGVRQRATHDSGH